MSPAVAAEMMSDGIRPNGQRSAGGKWHLPEKEEENGEVATSSY